MKRKQVKVGISLAVTLPRELVKELGLNAGQEEETTIGRIPSLDDRVCRELGAITHKQERRKSREFPKRDRFPPKQGSPK